MKSDVVFLMVECYQITFARTLCWSLSLLLWMLWFCLWKEQILHIPLPPIHCLLHCRIWLHWHLCPPLLARIFLVSKKLQHCDSIRDSFFFFFLSLLQAIEVKAGHSFLVEHKGCCIFDTIVICCYFQGTK